MKKIEILRPFMGHHDMQICCEKDTTDTEILVIANTENPTKSGWTKVVRKGDLEPVVCSEHPNRLHIIVKH